MVSKYVLVLMHLEIPTLVYAFSVNQRKRSICQGILHRAGAHLKGRRLGVLGSGGCASEHDREISPLGSKQ